jgi:hypothetical protein
VGIDLEEDKQQVINKIMEDDDMASKGLKIDDAGWILPEGKPLGMTASLGIWFDTAEAAKWAEMNGLVCHQRYIAASMHTVWTKRDAVDAKNWVTWPTTRTSLSGLQEDESDTSTDVSVVDGVTAGTSRAI